MVGEEAGIKAFRTVSEAKPAPPRGWRSVAKTILLEEEAGEDPKGDSECRCEGSEAQVRGLAGGELVVLAPP